MKVYSYASKINEAGHPYLVKDRTYKVDGRKRFDTPEKIADFVMGIDIQNCAEEFMYVLCFDSALHLIGCFELSHGTVNAALVTPREIFLKSLQIGATQIALTHNHPSGDLTPSKEDVMTTKQVAEAGNLLCIPLVDHLIVSRDGYVSMRSEGCF